VNSEIRQREVIERQKEEIERASAEKSEFMSFASHEIRNPVTGIRGYASLILEGDVGPVSPPVRETVAKISALGDDVLGLISQFLTKSKAELGQIAYESIEFDLAEVTRELADGMRAHAEQKGLALRGRTEPGLRLPVRADITKIKEAVRNVIDNAIKYTRTGSVTVSMTRVGDKAQIAVADTGVGIAPDAMPHLFKKFSRADAQQVNRQGSGIGLYLAKVFLEAQGGRLWAESEGQEKGSTFYIELPMVR
jgi:signal transduction histidine kinase